ncbi:MAG: hypothetical protein ACO2OY_01000 [Thermodesulfobacteriaceae bacterium]|jgi:hypothetical protein
MTKAFAAFSILFILLSFLPLNTVAQQRKTPDVKILGRNCYKARIIENYRGQIIEADDGHIYKVDRFYTIDTRFWSKYDRLLVCYTVGSVNGHIVKVYTLRNLDDDSDVEVDVKRIK